MRRVEVARSAQEAAHAAEIRILNDVHERRLGASDIARKVVHRMAGTCRYAVHLAEVHLALEHGDDGARRIAGTHAAALDDQRDVGNVDFAILHNARDYSLPPHPCIAKRAAHRAALNVSHMYRAAFPMTDRWRASPCLRPTVPSWQRSSWERARKSSGRSRSRANSPEPIRSQRRCLR